MKIVFPLLILASAVAASAQIPARVELQILTTLKAIEASGSYTGNYDEDRNTKANNDLEVLLVKNGSRADVLKYAFPKLEGRIGVATSPDGKFRIYSWDMNTGGTMHDHECVFQYQGSGGKTYSRACKDGDENIQGEDSYYIKVQQVEMLNGPVYLANSLFIASGADHGQSIDAMRIDGDTLNTKVNIFKTREGITNTISVEYSPFSLRNRFPNGLFSFDAVTKQLKFPVVVEREGSVGDITNRFITYRFDGTYFVKAS